MSYVEAHACYGIHKNLIHIEHLRSSNEHVSAMKVLVSYETDFGNGQRSMHVTLLYVCMPLFI